MSKLKDLTGQKFEKLTVISFYGRKGKRYLWNCKCDCGNECIVDSYKLRHNFTKSCGCLRVTKKIKHGDYKTRLYRIYNGMKNRCLLPTDSGYKWYGAKGIKVCEEWLNNYQCFKEWALNNGYMNNLTIDRIDFNGNYCPENCRWITREEQPLNQSNVKLIEYKGDKYSVRGLAKKFNINFHTLYSRIKRGWSIDRALQRKDVYGCLT